MTGKGVFISFEGGEGAGKTTQINNVAKYLSDKGHSVLTTREPGGTPEGEKIRNLLVQRDGGKWLPITETLLLFAARAEHVERIIKPALAAGKIVISDRFTDSTYAYQGYGHGLTIETIDDLNKTVLDNFKPDLTFILDVAPDTGLKRSGRRLAAEQLQVRQTEDRFENLEIAFHERLHEGFLAIAKSDPARCQIIDATQKAVDVTDEIIALLAKRGL